MTSIAAAVQQEIAALPEPKVYSYSRWSTPDQANGDSFRRQADAAAKWAERHGLTLDTSLAIVDEGVSAYRGNNATDGGLSRFLEACRRGLIEPGSYLLVESLDRISRMSPRKVQVLINEIVDSGVTIVTLNDNQEFTAERLDNDPTALLIALMVAWRAHDESKSKGRRVAEAWEEKRNRLRANPAERLTSRAPSWLVPLDDGSWGIDEEKAETVRRVYAMTLAGSGEHAIAWTFNTEGVPPLGRAKQWHRSTISKVLRNPSVIGKLVPGRIEYHEGRRHRVLEEPVEGAFPSIISEADWVAVRALKDGSSSSARGRHAVRPIAHFLAGLAKCPCCGGTMTRVYKGNRKKAGSPKLVCSTAKNKAGCTYVSVKIDEVEQALVSGWGNLFADIPAGGAFHALDEEREGLLGSIDWQEDRLSEIDRQITDSPSVLLSRLAHQTETELADLRQKLAAVEERQAIADHGLIAYRAGQLHELLEPTVSDQEEGNTDLDIGAVNAALKVLFAAVVVDYIGGTLRFRWRQGGEASIRYAWPQ